MSIRAGCTPRSKYSIVPSIVYVLSPKVIGCGPSIGHDGAPDLVPGAVNDPCSLPVFYDEDTTSPPTLGPIDVH